MHQQVRACDFDDAVFLQQPRDRDLFVGITPDHALERDVFARMVKAVRIVLEEMELLHLFLDEVEQPHEAHVLAMPHCNRIVHIDSSTAAPKCAIFC